MNKNTPIYIDDFDYELPDERIAKFPLSKRDASKLLIYKNGKISENIFSNLADYLPENSLLVYNNTRVIQARLIFQKATGTHRNFLFRAVNSCGLCAFTRCNRNLCLEVYDWKFEKMEVRNFDQNNR